MQRWSCSVESHGVHAVQVTRQAHGSNLDKYRPFSTVGERHPGFEKDVGSRLTRPSALAAGVSCRGEPRMQPRFVVGCEQHDRCDRHAKELLDHRSIAGGTRAGRSNQFGPLEWVQVQGPQVVEQRLCRRAVSTVDYCDPAGIGLREIFIVDLAPQSRRLCDESVGDVTGGVVDGDPSGKAVDHLIVLLRAFTNLNAIVAGLEHVSTQDDRRPVLPGSHELINHCLLVQVVAGCAVQREAVATYLYVKRHAWIVPRVLLAGRRDAQAFDSSPASTSGVALPCPGGRDPDRSHHTSLERPPLQVRHYFDSGAIIAAILCNPSSEAMTPRGVV